MIKFEKVSKYENEDLTMPIRKTIDSAGYDMCAAEDVVIPSYFRHMDLMYDGSLHYKEITLAEMAELTKGKRPTLIPTGMKCQMDRGQYLELSVRSSCPLKYWLVLANGVGIIDGDYYNNESNEGEIFFQVINLSPFPILLKKGDTIGQGVIRKYEFVSDDKVVGARVGGFGSTGANFG